MSNPITPLTPEQEAQNAAETNSESYLHRVAVGIDMAANVALGGHPDMTISSETAVMDYDDHGIKHDIGKAVSGFLDLFQKDHGAGAAEADLVRAQNAAEIEQGSGILPTN